jgi:hypothetical protein
VAVGHATVPPQPAKKFHVFHQWHFWKATNFQESSPSAEYPVVATSHSQQNPGVVRKAVRQSINWVLWQANPEVTSDYIRVLQYARDFIQASLRDFGIDMYEPEHVAARSTRAHVHLHCPIGVAPNELIAKARAESRCAVRASAVGHNNLRFWCSVAQMLKKWAYECRLVKNRNND